MERMERMNKRQSKNTNKWRKYEIEKSKLRDMNLSPVRYEAAIRELAERLKV